MSTDNGRELGWNDEIQNDGQEFTLLEPGRYTFRVEKMERKRTTGEGKLPPCNMAALTIKLDDKCVVNEKLVLHSSLEWKLCSFFKSIGQRKQGEKQTMDWAKVPGASGVAEVGIREYKSRDGETRQINHITKFIDAAEAEKAMAENKDGLPF